MRKEREEGEVRPRSPSARAGTESEGGEEGLAFKVKLLRGNVEVGEGQLRHCCVAGVVRHGAPSAELRLKRTVREREREERGRLKRREERERGKCSVVCTADSGCTA